MNSVSPPEVGCESKKNVVKPGGCNSYETSECQTVDVIASAYSKLKDEFESLKVFSQPPQEFLGFRSKREVRLCLPSRLSGSKVSRR